MTTKNPKSLAAEARLLARQIDPLFLGDPHARLLNDLADSVEYLSSLESSWEQTRIALATMRNDLDAMRGRAEAAEAKVRALESRPSGEFTFQAQTDLAIVRLLAIAERFPPGAEHFIEHDGFRGRVVGYYQTEEGKPGVALQLVNARVVHVYGTKWLGE